MDALSFDEMQSEGALLSHIANARFETNRLIWDRRPPSGAGAALNQKGKPRSQESV
jgi:hypothetical protein